MMANTERSGGRSRRIFWLQAAVVVTASAVAILVADVAYRWIDLRRDVIPRKLSRNDDTLGWALNPGMTAASWATGSRVVYSTNSHGWRDSESSYAKPQGVLRIAAVGDSRTFGFGVPIEQHFTRLIEGYFTDVEVLNFGVQGYGVDQELLALRLAGLKYQPDIVIAYVAHFGNHRHMHAVRWGRPKPKFEVRDTSLVLTNVPVPAMDTVGSTIFHRWDAVLTTASPLYRDLSSAFMRLVRAATGRKENGSEPIEAMARADSVDETEVDRVAVAILYEMHKESRQAGATLLVVTEIPRLHAQLTMRGINSLDVSVPMANALFQLPRGLEHVSESGNGVLAWEIVRCLVERGLIPPERLAIAAATSSG